MASFAEDCRRALDTEWRTEARSEPRVGDVGSVEEMAERHCWYAAADLQLITRSSRRSALEQTTADFTIDSIHKEPTDDYEQIPAEPPPEHLICSFHEAVTLLRTYMGTVTHTRLYADRSDVDRDLPASETPASSSPVVRAALKLTILMETVAGLAFFGWVLNGG